ncbi:chemotaxis protein CheB [Candidatus Entotheonella palauensis]|uniref:Chemotaxis protein CheR n=1 Tax=Candidatus Entotheonella gemina TaxID=1429439 RepID=W4MAS3_9BACT|nr:chemotaxis protein CheB [Candidatus Entotheonella palauensis]ETX06747.1 MAG: hypothetical protein ETSY2_15275 [Candidatus Entotheonella gemina]
MPQHQPAPAVIHSRTATVPDAGNPTGMEPVASESTLTHIVGIGASAGGLQALESFFEHFIPPPGMAFVVVQHLSPDFKSLMHELLARHTQMRTVCVDQDMRVEPQTIYLNTARQDLTLNHGVLQVSDFPDLPGMQIHRPIDHFLSSLAETAGEKAIAIILSGTGSDGELGVRRIKEHGGTVLVQDTASATFDGMPRSALATGVVDAVMSPEHMPRAILGSISPLIPSPTAEFAMDEDKIVTIAALLGQQCPIDIMPYRRTTLYRRIHRRMMLTDVNEIDAYIAILRSSAEERGMLVQDLLINVTRFFRDSEAYRVLEREVIPTLLDRIPEGETIRIWVTACSTGEEAYSIAMLLREQLDQRSMKTPVKIFATDVDQEALAMASSGCYPERIAEDLPAERLERFFVYRDTGYQVIRSLREMIIFAPHDLTQEPPFAQMELVSCRNCLIYLEPYTQQHVLSLLGYALRDQGYLWLGPSESIDPLSAYFQPVQRKWRLFRKIHPVPPPRAAQFTIPAFPTAALFSHTHDVPKKSGSRVSAPQIADPKPWSVYHNMVETYCPPALIVSDRGSVLWVVGEGAAYLKRPAGMFSTELLQVIIDDLVIPVSTALHRLRQGKTEVAYNSIRLPGDDGEQWIDLRVRRIMDDQHPGGLILITFERTAVVAESQADNGEVYDFNKLSSQHIRNIQEELEWTKANLQATIQELETSNEEYQATNEELKASNQELHSSNEELHSVNQELYTVNAEYQSKFNELMALHNDIDNLLRSTDIGTVFLDQKLRIRKFTSAATTFIPLLPQDIGRPLNHLALTFAAEHFLQDVEHVLNGGEPVERELQTQSGTWFTLRILPFVLDDGARTGAVLNFIDLTSIKEARCQAQATVHLLQSTLDTHPSQIAVLNCDGNIILVNDAWQHAAANDTVPGFFDVGENYLQLCDRISPDDWPEAPRIAAGICQMLRHERDAFDIEYAYHGSGAERWFKVQAKRLSGDGPPSVILTHEDTTERKHMKERAALHAHELAEANVLLAERNTELIEFTRAINHDLQEPLRQVVTFSQLLQQHLAGTLEQEAEESLGFVIGGAQRMLTLVQHLTDLAHVGQVEMKRAWSALDACVQEALKALGLRVAESGAEVMDEGLPEVMGDSAMLTQLYQNLIGNAIKFSAHRQPVIHLTAERQQEGWLLGVRDNGIGIDPVHAKIIFDPFKRLHGRSQYDGNGLGLAVCRRIVRRHGGEIWADLEVQQGAYFKFTLPDPLP